MEDKSKITVNRDFVASLMDACIVLSITTVGAYFIGRKVGYNKAIKKGVAIRYTFKDSEGRAIVATLGRV